jgi:hypothetical protein
MNWGSNPIRGRNNPAAQSVETASKAHLSPYPMEVLSPGNETAVHAMVVLTNPRNKGLTTIFCK